MNYRGQRTARAAFTLIELIIVIAIISILASIIFPVFASAREKARQTSCTSNLKELNIAYFMYTSDNDDEAMPYVEKLTPTQYQFWDTFENRPTLSFRPSQGLIQPYLRDGRIVDCSDAPANSRLFVGSGYGYNYQFLNKDFVPVSLSKVTSPSDTILFADAAYITPPPTISLVRTDGLFPPSVSVSDDNPDVQGRHLGFANVEWVDGHMKAKLVSFPDTKIVGLASDTYFIGDIVNPAYPMDDCSSTTKLGDCDEDYYFLLLKP